MCGVKIESLNIKFDAWLFTVVQAISSSLTEVYNSIAYKRFKVIQKENFPVWNATNNRWHDMLLFAQKFHRWFWCIQLEPVLGDVPSKVLNKGISGA